MLPSWLTEDWVMKHSKREEERRAHTRVPLDARVELFSGGDPLGGYHPVDVSEGGLQIRGFPLPALTPVKVFMQPEGQGQALLVDGVVAWRTLGRSGIQFLDLCAAAQQTLQQLVETSREGR